MLWKMGWQFHVQLAILLLSGPTQLFLNFYSKELKMSVYTKTYTPINLSYSSAVKCLPSRCKAPYTTQVRERETEGENLKQTAG